MKLIVGLGNPEPKYLLTPHNIGFMIIDSLSDGSEFKKKHKSLIQKTKWGDQDVLLAKPQTYMNLSGEAVREIVKFYKINIKDLLVVQDDIDQDFLKMKFQKNRSEGGHNGIRSIHAELNTPDYARLKLGIKTETKADTSRYVLSPFKKETLSDLEDFLKRSMEAVRFFVQNDFEKSSNQFNQKVI